MAGNFPLVSDSLFRQAIPLHWLASYIVSGKLHHWLYVNLMTIVMNNQMPPVAYYSCADTQRALSYMHGTIHDFLKCILLDRLEFRTLFMHKCCQLQLRHPGLLIVCMLVPNHIYRELGRHKKTAWSCEGVLASLATAIRILHIGIAMSYTVYTSITWYNNWFADTKLESKKSTMSVDPVSGYLFHQVDC